MIIFYRQVQLQSLEKSDIIELRERNRGINRYRYEKNLENRLSIFIDYPLKICYTSSR
jgi:hypothetical protein